MLKNIAFVLLGVFVVLVVVGVLAAAGKLSLGTPKGAPTTALSPVATGYIKSVKGSDGKMSLVINPVDNPDIVSQSCVNNTCLLSPDVEVNVRPLNKNLNFASPSAFYRTLQTIYPTVLFEFTFSAGEITKIVEK